MQSDYGGGGGGPDGGSRRSRNPVARKTVDCHASVVYHLQHRFYQPSNLPRPFLPPTVDSVPFLPALFPPPSPSWPPRFIADSFCTRYVHQSINKQRTAIHCCGFSPDNKRLVTGAASGELTLWNAQTFNFETILAAHDDAVRCMSWGGEGSAAVLCTGDDSGVIKYWFDWRTHPANDRTLHCSTNGRSLTHCRSSKDFTLCRGLCVDVPLSCPLSMSGRLQ